MKGMLLNNFPPLQGAITQAESWTRYLTAQQPQFGKRPPADVAVALESIVWVGVKLGEVLPFTWRVTFDNLFRPGQKSWTTVEQFDAVRQAVRLLFFSAREAMDMTRQLAETLQEVTGRQPGGMDRLLEVIESARQLEETVFRDWPVFAEPLPLLHAVDTLPVDEALAEALGLSVAEARLRMDARRREIGTTLG
jgi:hypothetical protein